MPLAAAAFCPHPPLLLPRFAGRKPVLTSLRAACRTAVEHLLGSPADAFVVLAAGRGNRAVPAGTRGTLAPWGVDVPVALGAPAGGPSGAPAELPLGLAVGAWLLGRPPQPVRGQVVDAGLGRADTAALGRALVAGPERIGLLVMGDGSAMDRERPQSPPAATFDAAVAKAFGDGDAAALLAIEVPVAAGLECTGRAPWQALAGAAGPRPPARPRLLFHEAPFGVGYLVASWT